MAGILTGCIERSALLQFSSNGFDIHQKTACLQQILPQLRLAEHVSGGPSQAALKKRLGRNLLPDKRAHRGSPWIGNHPNPPCACAPVFVYQREIGEHPAGHRANISPAHSPTNAKAVALVILCGKNRKIWFPFQKLFFIGEKPHTRMPISPATGSAADLTAVHRQGRHRFQKSIGPHKLLFSRFAASPEYLFAFCSTTHCFFPFTASQYWRKACSFLFSPHS